MSTDKKDSQQPANTSAPQADAILKKPLAPEQSQDALDAMMAQAFSARGPAVPAEEGGATLAPVNEQRCGLIAIVGKPNVGKSTLLNALVGQKVSITSRKAQTTRHRITGMRTRDATQFVFVDTPGFQTRHGNALNRSLNRTVVGAVNDVDLIVFVVEAGQFNLADAKVLALLPEKTPAILLANKFDLIHRRAEIAPWLRSMQEPYTSTVIIDQYEEEGNLRKIAATIVVERDGHKGMIIGEKGEKLKRIGTEARHELEALTGGKVFLEIWVKVRSGWADDEARVKTFGYE